ncbi:imidazole glycerol phosphate synthase subunit HisH [Vallitalea okinawensis]|uniref:imidazole glycerol phosphate synthase subunit HisH n=1 Tax=Vallitalea okinawensis TaxID=2078660 RepID=UPI000CFBF8AD|nr:imidazole glycerol phosphate synthase subunit HisH [Vallitalea okinawensis]
MIGIIDYGMGNLKSVTNSLNFIGVRSFISNDFNELKKADSLILPGVGAFKDAMRQIKQYELDDFIVGAVKENKPLLGICLGMQLLVEKSLEDGEHKGLGIIDGEVLPIEGVEKVPHMGWNQLSLIDDSPIWGDLKQPYVYFVHSYYVSTPPKNVIATVNYGGHKTVGIQKGRVYGLQFHPEKSGEEGLTILRNFAIIGGEQL